MKKVKLERILSLKLDTSEKKRYSELVVRVFAILMLGYIGSYFVRDTFKSISEILIARGLFSGYGWEDPKILYGYLMSLVGVCYGLGKFILGVLFDRLKARIALGLTLLSSGFFFILSVWILNTHSLILISLIFIVFGFIQGSANPTTYRVLAFWFPAKTRGTWATIWNISHNIGTIIGPLLISLAFTLLGVQGNDPVQQQNVVMYAVLFPGITTMLFSLLLLGMRDKPEEYGLSNVHTLFGEKIPEPVKKVNIWASLKENIFSKKELWYIYIANLFVYVLRYAPLTWVVVYANHNWDFQFNKAKWFFIIFEAGAIPGTIIFGYLADRLWNKRRARILLASAFLMFPGIVMFSFAGKVVWLSLLGLAWIGFFCYNPINLHSIMCMDIVKREVVGAATGLNGLFGYIGSGVLVGLVLGKLITHFGFVSLFIFLFIAWFVPIIMMLLCWNVGPVETPMETRTKQEIAA